jgi:hypothetical protein
LVATRNLERKRRIGVECLRIVLFIVIGHFRRGFGRRAQVEASVPSGAPAESTDGVRFLGSWVEAGLRRCFQIVDCDEPAALQRWSARWRHCVEFEVIPVVPSAEAFVALQPLVDGPPLL